MKTQQNAEKNTSKVGIVINRMYVGDYLSENLGHEVINFFKADNGRHYIYLNATGNFAKEHENKIGYMLFVKYYDKGLVEVIGMAKGLEEVPGANMSLNRSGVDMEIWKMQKDYIDKEGGISYAGVSILDIFNNAEQQSIFITYKVGREGNVYLPAKGLRIFLRYGNEAQNELDGDKMFFALKNYNLPKTSLKSYIYPENSESKRADYSNVLNNLINNEELWTTEGIEMVNIKNTKIQQSVSIFDICQIYNDENRFSYALAYFMSLKKYRELWQRFFASLHIELGKDYTVTREADAKIDDSKWVNDNKPGGGRIDLLVKDDKNIIVIENKIKSDINTKKSDKGGTTQLNRYANYVEWLIDHSEGKKPKPYFLILTPKYNTPEIGGDMKKVYKIVTYYDLYNFLKKNISVFEDDSNFVDFYNAMFRHTRDNVNDYLYYDMMEKFVQRINEATK